MSVGRYFNFYQWLDDSVAYFLRVATSEEGNCAYYKQWDNPKDGLYFGPCQQKSKAQILCEMPREKKDHQQVYIQTQSCKLS